jgi:hypothetical protein
MDFLKDLLPRTARAWGFWFILLITAYLFYYLLWPYSCCDVAYENARWSSSRDPQDVPLVDGLKVLVRAPKWVADFIEREVEVSIENTTDEPKLAVVTLDAEPGVGRAYIYDVDGRQQNTLTFRDIQPHSKVVSEFRVRVSGGQYGKQLRLRFRLNDKPLPLGYVVDPKFSCFHTLSLWIIRELLLPPGSNGSIPVFVTIVYYPAIRALVKRQGQSKVEVGGWKKSGAWVVSILAWFLREGDYSEATVRCVGKGSASITIAGPEQESANSQNR